MMQNIRQKTKGERQKRTDRKEISLWLILGRSQAAWVDYIKAKGKRLY
jgi:hypothetical protein